jgi:hypothetical protein
MHKRLDRRQTLRRRVLEQTRDEVERRRLGAPEDLTVSRARLWRPLTLLKGWGLICGNLCSM